VERHRTHYWTVTGGNATVASGQGTKTATINVGTIPATIEVKVTIKDYKGCVVVCTKNIPVIYCIVNCTYTQGFFGSTTGRACTPENDNLSASRLIARSIRNMPGAKLYIGRTPDASALGGSFSATPNDSARLNAILPGGSGALVLAKDYNLSALINYPPLTSGKISNNLLSQTIVLALNIHLTPSQITSLGNFPLQGKWLVTMKKDPASSCASPKALSCYVNGVATNSLNSWLIPANVVNALPTKTVKGLLDFASNALGGAPLPSGVTLSNILTAVDAINNAFDGCRFFIAWADCKQDCNNFGLTCAVSYNTSAPLYTSAPKLATDAHAKALDAAAKTPTGLISAFPNPFVDRVKFVLKADMDAHVTLDVFNLIGQKLAVLHSASMRQGETKVIEYSPMQRLSGGLLYRVTRNGETFTGKLIHDAGALR
jgi:hypothetical protein